MCDRIMVARLCWYVCFGYPCVMQIRLLDVSVFVGVFIDLCSLAPHAWWTFDGPDCVWLCWCVLYVVLVFFDFQRRMVVIVCLCIEGVWVCFCARF